MPKEYLESFRDKFSPFGIELVFMTGENELEADGKRPSRMLDPDLLRYAERLLAKKFGKWQRRAKVFLFTFDKGFITHIEIRKVPQPDSPETKIRLIQTIVGELTPHIPELKPFQENILRSGGKGEDDR